MGVRAATRDDWPALLALARQGMEESPRHRGKFSARKTENLLRDSMGTLLVDGPGGAFVAEEEGRIVGVLLGCMGEHALCELKIAYEAAFYVLPAHRRGGEHARALIRAFERWALDQGAQEAMMGDSSLTNPRAVGRFYRSAGYMPCEYGYSKELRS